MNEWIDELSDLTAAGDRAVVFAVGETRNFQLAPELLAGLGQCAGAHVRGEPDLFDSAKTAGQTEVSGFVDRPHTALAYQAQDFVSLSQPKA